jgi:hypothetical protein
LPCRDFVLWPGHRAILLGIIALSALHKALGWGTGGLVLCQGFSSIVGS